METTIPILLCLPAMGVAAGYYHRLADGLRQAGCGRVEVIELRGQGEHPARARRGADFGYREIVEQDLPAWLDRLDRRSPRAPVYLVGHSLGGQLAVLASAALAHRLAGLVLIAAGTAHHRAWPSGQRWRARLVVGAIRFAAAVLPWYPGQWLGFGGEQPRRLMRDWGYNAHTGRYQLDGSERSPADLEQALAEVRLPVLSIGVRHDPLAPEGAREELLAKLPAAAIARRVIDGVAGDRPWRQHFSWVRESATVVALVANWLAAQPRASDAATPARPAVTRVAASA